jgi:hypothetical protein
MARYQAADVSFDVPTDWQDKTVVAFAAPSKPGVLAPNVVLTRDTMKPDETLDAYGDRMIVDLVKNLAGFRLLAKEPRDVGVVRGIEIRFSWTGSSGKPITQHMVIAKTGARSILGLNMTCAESEAKKLEPIVSRIFASLEVVPRGPEGA